MKPGANCEGWWTSKHLVKQIVEKAIPIFEKLHPGSIGLFAFDNATSHA
ncbi:4754_t:CDS:2, partial [Entrophospora sp. SA101]